jgi:hypothetical protein
MTGFNNRVVNPGQVPFKGYWTVVEDCGLPGQLWNKVSWTESVTTGFSVEVHVCSVEERRNLGTGEFIAVTNGVSFPSIRGRYIELRLGITRDKRGPCEAE